MDHPMQGYNPYEGSDEVPEMTPEESKAAAKKASEFMKARKETESSERRVSTEAYGGSLVDQILKNKPNLTREEVEEMLDCLG